MDKEDKCGHDFCKHTRGRHDLPGGGCNFANVYDQCDCTNFKEPARSIFAQVYQRSESKHGYLTPLQMIEKMLEAAETWNGSDTQPYMRFLIRIHGGNGIVSQVMSLKSITRKDHGWSLQGIVQGPGYPYDNRYFHDGYDGIEIVDRVSYEDESWQDWLS
jgi:hypothetical protein